MKKTSLILKLFLALVLVLNLSLVSAAAAETSPEELSLVSEDSGYKILVPGYIEIKDVAVEDSVVTVVVMETPEKDSNGNYPIFEIVTTDKNASSAESFPGITTEGQIGNFNGTFNAGKLMYAPKLSISKNLKDLDKNLIYMFDFNVYDKNNEPIFSVADLNFMFVNKSSTPAPEKEVIVSAKPTSSKVVVNGKQVAFEAYSINGNNYFKLRDLAMAINGTAKQFQVGFDSAKNAINLTKETAYTPAGNELAVTKNPTAKDAKLTKSGIYINGAEVQLTAYNIGGNNYFKLRDVAKAINFGVNWDGKLNMIGLDTTTGYTE